MPHSHLNELQLLLRADADPQDLATVRGHGLRRLFLPHTLNLADGMRQTYLGGHLEVLVQGAVVMLQGLVIDEVDSRGMTYRVIELPVHEATQFELARFIIERSIQENTSVARNRHLDQDDATALNLHRYMQLASIWVASGHAKIAWARPPGLTPSVGDRLPLLQLNLVHEITASELDTFQGQKLLKRAQSWFSKQHAIELQIDQSGLRLPQGFCVAMVNRMLSPIPAVIMREGDSGLAMSRFMEF